MVCSPRKLSKFELRRTSALVNKFAHGTTPQNYVNTITASSCAQQTQERILQTTLSRTKFAKALEQYRYDSSENSSKLPAKKTIVKLQNSIRLLNHQPQPNSPLQKTKVVLNDQSEHNLPPISKQLLSTPSSVTEEEGIRQLLSVTQILAPQPALPLPQGSSSHRRYCDQNLSVQSLTSPRASDIREFNVTGVRKIVTKKQTCITDLSSQNRQKFEHYPTLSQRQQALLMQPTSSGTFSAESP